MLHGAVERRFQFILVHIVLVLPHPDGFGVNLYEFGQGVHQSATDGDSSAHGDIIVGELIAGHLRGRVDGSTVLAHHKHLQGAVVSLRGDKLLRLTAGRAIAYRYGLYLVLLHQACQLAACTGIVRLGRMGKDGLIVKQITLRIEAHHLAACAIARVDGQHTLLPEGRCQQQLFEISGKYADGLLVGLLLRAVGKLGLDGRAQQALVSVAHGHSNLLGTLTLRAHKLAFKALHGHRIIGRSNAHTQETLLLATAYGQHAMRRAARERFAPVKIVAVLVALSLLTGYHLGGDTCLADKDVAHGVP